MVTFLLALIFIAAIVGLLWAYYQYEYLAKIETPRSLGMMEDDEK